MRFNRYLKEEYFTRVGDYEIFLNPSQREVSKLYASSQSIRSLVDFNNKVCFMFDGDLLHQVAIKQIINEYNNSGLFYCGEAYTINYKGRPTMIIDFSEGGFKVVNHQAMWIDKEIGGDINWFLKYLKHLSDFANYKVESN